MHLGKARNANRLTNARISSFSGQYDVVTYVFVKLGKLLRERDTGVLQEQFVDVFQGCWVTLVLFRA